MSDLHHMKEYPLIHYYSKIINYTCFNLKQQCSDVTLVPNLNIYLLLHRTLHLISLILIQIL